MSPVPVVDHHLRGGFAAPLRATVLAALLLACAAVPAQSLGDSLPPGFATPQDVKKFNDTISTLKSQLDAAQKAQKAAADRADQAEAAARKAQDDVRRGGSAGAEQLDALRRERDAARAQLQAARDEIADLKPALAAAQADARRAGQAARPDPAIAAERDRLRGEADGLRRQVATLKDELAATRRPAAPVAAAASSVVTTTAPTVTPPNPDAPPDLSEITVPGCGAACPSFMLLPPTGRLMLGSGADAITAEFSHRVAMGRTEVTVGQWKAFWNAPDRDYQPVKTDNTHCNWNDKDVASSDRLPVACVNLADAEAYIRWFNRRHATGLATALGVTPQRLEVGLPTELEWEYAARGGRWTQEFLWDAKASDIEKCRHAQIYACPGGTIPVATRLHNGFKLHDMIGNVWEWTASPDRARSAIPSNGREQPVGVSASRVVRGGSFGIDGDWLRLSNRGSFTPGFRNYDLGFRLVARIAP